MTRASKIEDAATVTVNYYTNPAGLIIRGNPMIVISHHPHCVVGYDRFDGAFETRRLIVVDFMWWTVELWYR